MFTKLLSSINNNNIMCALRDILFCVVLVTAALVLKKMMKELFFCFSHDRRHIGG